MSIKRQSGLALLDVLFAIALMGLVIAGSASMMRSKKEIKNAEDYRVRIELVIEALQKHQYQQHTQSPPPPIIDEFPPRLNDLVTADEQFWINCTPEDEAARYCLRPDYVPWTYDRIGYEAGQKNVTIGSGTRLIAYAELTFPLSRTVIEPMYRPQWSKELLKIPYAKELPNGDVTVMVYNPLLSQLYDAFLQHDGSVPLSGDWDVGGQFAVTNAKDLTISNSDGTQKIVSTGLMNVMNVEHGDYVYKPSCPINQKADISVSIGSIYIAGEDKLTGSVKPYIMEERSDSWRVGYVVRGSGSDGQPKEIRDGIVQVLVWCKHE